MCQSVWSLLTTGELEEGPDRLTLIAGELVPSSADGTATEQIIVGEEAEDHKGYFWWQKLKVIAFGGSRSGRSGERHTSDPGDEDELTERRSRFNKPSISACIRTSSDLDRERIISSASSGGVVEAQVSSFGPATERQATTERGRAIR